MATIVKTKTKTVVEEEKEKEREKEREAQRPRHQAFTGAGGTVGGGDIGTLTPVMQILDGVTVRATYRGTMYDPATNRFIHPDGRQMTWNEFQELGIMQGNAPPPLSNTGTHLPRARDFVADRGAQWAPAALRYVMVNPNPRAPQNAVFVNTDDFTERIPIGRFLERFVVHSDRAYDPSRPRGAQAELPYMRGALPTAAEIYKEKDVDMVELNMRVDFATADGVVHTIKRKIMLVPLKAQRRDVLGTVARILEAPEFMGPLDKNNRDDCRNRGLGIQLRNPWLYMDETPDDTKMIFWQERFDTVEAWLRAQKGLEAAPLKNIKVNARVYCTAPREGRTLGRARQRETLRSLAEVADEFEKDSRLIVDQQLRRAQLAVDDARKPNATLQEIGRARAAQRVLDAHLAEMQRRRHGETFREAQEDLEEILAARKSRRRASADDNDDDAAAEPVKKKTRRADVDAERQAQVVARIAMSIEELEAQSDRDGTDVDDADTTANVLREIVFYGITAPPSFMGSDVDYEAAFFRAVRDLQRKYRADVDMLHFLAEIESEYNERARAYNEKLRDRYAVPVFVDGVVASYVAGPLRPDIAAEAAPLGIEEQLHGVGNDAMADLAAAAENAQDAIRFMECDKCKTERCIYDFKRPHRYSIAVENDGVLNTCYDVVIYTEDGRLHRGDVNLLRTRVDNAPRFFRVSVVEDSDTGEEFYELKDPETNAVFQVMSGEQMRGMIRQMALGTTLELDETDGRRYVAYVEADDDGTVIHSERWPSPVRKLVCIQRDGTSSVYEDARVLARIEGVDDLPFICGDMAEVAANVHSERLLTDLRYYRNLRERETDPATREELRAQILKLEAELHHRPPVTDEEAAEITSRRFVQWVDQELAESARAHDAAADRVQAAVTAVPFLAADADEGDDDEDIVAKGKSARKKEDDDDDEDDQMRVEKEEEDEVHATRATQRLQQTISALSRQFQQYTQGRATRSRRGATSSAAVAAFKMDADVGAIRDAILSEIDAITFAQLRVDTANTLHQSVVSYLDQLAATQASDAAVVEFIAVLRQEVLAPLARISSRSGSSGGVVNASYPSNITVSQNEKGKEDTKTEKKKASPPTLHEEVVALMAEYPQGIGSETVARLVHQQRKAAKHPNHEHASTEDAKWWRNWRAQVRHAINPNHRLKNDTFLVYPGTHYYVLREHITGENIPTIIKGLQARNFNKMDATMEKFARETLEKIVRKNQITAVVEASPILSVRELQRYGLKSRHYDDLLQKLLSSENWGLSKEETKSLLDEWVGDYVHKVPIASNRLPPQVALEHVSSNASTAAAGMTVANLGTKMETLQVDDDNVNRDIAKGIATRGQVEAKELHGVAHSLFESIAPNKSLPLTLAEVEYMVGRVDGDADRVWLYLEKLVIAYAAAQAALDDGKRDGELWSFVLANGPSRVGEFLQRK